MLALEGQHDRNPNRLDSPSGLACSSVPGYRWVLPSSALRASGEVGLAWVEQAPLAFEAVRPAWVEPVLLVLEAVEPA